MALLERRVPLVLLIDLVSPMAPCHEQADSEAVQHRDRGDA